MHFVTSRTLSRLTLRVFTTLWTAGTIPSVAAAQAAADADPQLRAEARFCADQEALFAARMAFIEAKIEIKGDQRAEWGAFVAASREAEKPLRESCATHHPPGASDAMAELEVRDRMEALHENAHKGIRDAVARLKASLPVEQQRRLAEALLAPPFALRGPGFGSPPAPHWRAGGPQMERCSHPDGPPRP